jgi:DNA-binding transcriptional MerR regulator
LAQDSDPIFAFDLADLEPGIRSADELPSKLYFRIGEVAKLTGLKQHVLRYWETEFPFIAPKKMGSNHRMYRRKDVEFILEIKHLLYEKRYTIEGARKHLENKPKPLTKPAARQSAKPARRGSGGIVSSQPMPPRGPEAQSSLFGEAPPAAPELAALRRELEAILKFLREDSHTS